MKSKSDIAIRALVEKKRELLDKLLVLSIQSAITEQNIDRLMESRRDTMSGLLQNDESLETREKQTGIDARTQETKLFGKIDLILGAIQENNDLAISKIERDQEKLEVEKSSLDRENKLSGYINQTKSYRTYRPLGSQYSDQRQGRRLLDGTL
ncbi:MAG: hypothetical protein GY866_10360 [Proteobacteria bacterium]|nr:hypothetical protein [Pseudomonadota bacterium]